MVFNKPQHPVSLWVNSTAERQGKAMESGIGKEGENRKRKREKENKRIRKGKGK